VIFGHKYPAPTVPRQCAKYHSDVGTSGRGSRVRRHRFGAHRSLHAFINTHQRRLIPRCGVWDWWTDVLAHARSGRFAGDGGLPPESSRTLHRLRMLAPKAGKGNAKADRLRIPGRSQGPLKHRRHDVERHSLPPTDSGCHPELRNRRLSAIVAQAVSISAPARRTRVPRVTCGARRPEVEASAGRHPSQTGYNRAVNPSLNESDT